MADGPQDVLLDGFEFLEFLLQHQLRQLLDAVDP
jgi:hypothetical protein